MTIYWTRGDTPLPLNAGPTDLTGCTVIVRLKNNESPEATVLALPATVLPGTNGDLTVASSTIPVGSWTIEAEARKGATFVATFPNGTERQTLYVTNDLRD